MRLVQQTHFYTSQAAKSFLVPAPRSNKQQSQHTAMEQFSVAAQHAGSINHVHSFIFPPSTVSIVKEIRLTVTVLAVAWVAVTAIRQLRPYAKSS